MPVKQPLNRMGWTKKRTFIKKNDEMRLCQYGISGLFYQRVPDL